MFKLTILVEDENLSEALHALVGLVASMEPPESLGKMVRRTRPISGPEPKPNGSLKSKVAHLLGEYHPEEVISSSQINDLILKSGGNKNSYNYVVQGLRDEKLLRMKKRGLWQIVDHLK